MKTHCADKWRDEQPAVLDHREWGVPDHVFNVVIETVCAFESTQ